MGGEGQVAQVDGSCYSLQGAGNGAADPQLNLWDLRPEVQNWVQIWLDWFQILNWVQIWLDWVQILNWVQIWLDCIISWKVVSSGISYRHQATNSVLSSDLCTDGKGQVAQVQ